MSLMPEIQIQGEPFFILAGSERPVIRPHGLDSLTMEVQSDAMDTFINGGAPPDYPTMWIKEDEVTVEIPGLAYVHRLQCEGIFNLPKTEPDVVRVADEGWDEIVRTMYVLEEDKATVMNPDTVHPDYEYMVVQSRDEQQVGPGIWRLVAVYKGIVMFKTPKRKYTTDTREVQSSVNYVIEGEYADASLPWTVPRPRVGFTERFLFAGDIQPYYDLIREELTGPDLPTDVPTIIGRPIDSIAPEKKYNFPNGWRIEGIDAVSLLKTFDVWDITIQYVFAPQSEPTGLQQS